MASNRRRGQVWPHSIAPLQAAGQQHSKTNMHAAVQDPGKPRGIHQNAGAPPECAVRLAANSPQGGCIHQQRAAQQAEVVQRGGLVTLGGLNVQVHLLQWGSRRCSHRGTQGGAAVAGGGAGKLLQRPRSHSPLPRSRWCRRPWMMQRAGSEAPPVRGPASDRVLGVAWVFRCFSGMAGVLCGLQT